MTAIYGFVDPASHRGLLASDDREANSGLQADKVHFAFDRFALAVYGVDTPDHAINAVGAFHKVAGHSPPTDITELSTRLAEVLREYVKGVTPHYLAAVRSGAIPATSWQTLVANDANVVVLDVRDWALFDVQFGLPFGSGLLATPSVTQLDPLKLHRFALARTAAQCASEPLVPGIDGTTYLSYIGGKLGMDCRACPQLGALGASLLAENGTTIYRSCFSGPLDVVQQMMGKKLLGFSITCVCCDPKHHP